jgi:hypothetical protein
MLIPLAMRKVVFLAQLGLSSLGETQLNWYA